MVLNTTGWKYISRVSHVHGHDPWREDCGYFLPLLKEGEGSTIQLIKGCCLLSEQLTCLVRSGEKGPHVISIL